MSRSTWPAASIGSEQLNFGKLAVEDFNKANGTTYAAHVRLRTLTLGPINLTDVDALVAKAVDRRQGHWFGGRLVPASGVAGVAVTAASTAFSASGR